MSNLVYKQGDSLFSKSYVHFFGSSVIDPDCAKIIATGPIGMGRNIQVKVFSKKESHENLLIDALFGLRGGYETTWRTHFIDGNKNILMATKARIISKNTFENTEDLDLASELDCNMFTFELDGIISCLLEKVI